MQRQPKPPKVAIREYHARLTFGSAVVPVVFHNIMEGTIEWTRQTTGRFRGTLTGAFGQLRTSIVATNGTNLGMNVTKDVQDDYIELRVWDAAGNAADALSKCDVIVRVYENI